MVDRRKAAGVWYRTSESRRLREPPPHPCAVVVTGHDRSEVTSRLVLEAGDSAEPAAAQSDPTMARLVVITDMAESRATFRRVDSTSLPNCLGGLRPITGHRLATPFVPPWPYPGLARIHGCSFERRAVCKPAECQIAVRADVWPGPSSLDVHRQPALEETWTIDGACPSALFERRCIPEPAECVSLPSRVREDHPLGPPEAALCHVVRSNCPGLVRAAVSAGAMARRFAATMTPDASPTTSHIGTTETGTAPRLAANVLHTAPPVTIPSGTPMTIPTTAKVVACQATDEAI
jgi:hypothetical protein